MAVENARKAPGVPQNALIEIPQIRIDGREGRNRVALTEDEHVLAGSRRVRDIDVEEAAVKERDQRYGGGKGAARVHSFVRGVPALLQSEDADLGVFDLEKFQNPAAHARAPRRHGLG